MRRAAPLCPVSVVCVLDRIVHLLWQIGGLVPNLLGIIFPIVIMHGAVTPVVCHPGFHPPALTHSHTHTHTHTHDLAATRPDSSLGR